MSVEHMKVILFVNDISLSRLGELLEQIEKLQTAIPEVTKVTTEDVCFRIRSR